MQSGDMSALTARSFADRYADATSEKQLAQSFWRDFFTQVAGVDDLLSAGIEFEYPVKSIATGTIRFIDVLWPGVVLVEHKSAGEDLDKAEAQARDYLVSLADSKRPPVFIVSDFARIRVINVFADTRVEFSLTELPANLGVIESVLAGAVERATQAQVVADAGAANLMSALYVEFERAGYEGHQVSVFLVRMLFLLFGDDTRMWKRGLFQDFVESSPTDGTGLGGMLSELFQVLDTPTDQRSRTLNPALADFPYVNGGLFAEQLPVFSFTPSMRSALVAASLYDWASISPAIFGSMFQTVKSREERRELGEHYTSESNILKVIGPLFLNDLNERLSASWESPAALTNLRNHLGTLTYLDPACGAGNFLLVAYKRLRELELKIIGRQAELAGKPVALTLDGSLGLQVHLGQFFGIEHEEWSSQIATVAMFLADHQANLAAEEMTGLARNRFPLLESATIFHGNALEVSWQSVCPINESTLIFGNPPFNGARWMTPTQKQETVAVWQGARGVGSMDYVSNWFVIAGRIAAETGCRVGFVATNSISQGEQPAILWQTLLPLGLGIDFAHRSFHWSNGAAGQAGVTVVVIGFSNREKPALRPLWVYATPRSEATLKMVENINAYLLNARDVLITSRRVPLAKSVPPMENGNMPNDGGYLSNLSAEEVADIRLNDPVAAQYLRRLIGAREMLHNEERYCLWLVGVDVGEIRRSPELTRRVSAVRELRAASRREATRRLADRPAEFGEIRQPDHAVFVIPRITSEARDYVPIYRMEPGFILNDKVSFITEDLAVFGVLQSSVFNVWNKAVSGRTRNDTLISNNITYNNFPFPDLSLDQRDALEAAADHILTARQAYSANSLADLYDPALMPEPLRRAHRNNDRVVLGVFGLPEDASDDEILAVLFTRYEALSAVA